MQLDKGERFLDIGCGWGTLALYAAERYGVDATERWFRIWHMFLAWSTSIAEQGNAACLQLVLNKNLDRFDRSRWVKRGSPAAGARAVLESVVASS